MLTTLLFIAIIISCKTFTRGFAKLHRFSTKINTRMMPLSKTKLNVRLTTTCFCDDVGRNDKRKIEYKYDYDTLYTLIWFDCEDCKQLLSDVKNDGKNILYVNGTYYFFDETDETNTPLFYKNDQLVATDLFSIYEEIFYNKVDEE